MTNSNLGELYGVEFERTVLWAVLHNPSFAATRINILKPELFTHAGHMRIVQAVLDLQVKYSTPSFAPVYAHLKSEHAHAPAKSTASAEIEAALKALVKMRKHPPDATSVDYMVDALDRFVLQVKLRDALSQSITLLEQGEYDGVLKEIQQAYDDTAAMRPEQGINFLDVRAKMRMYHQRKKSSGNCPLNIPTLDSAMRGGLEKGTLGLFCGPPARGKTRALVQAGVAALLHGMNVVHVSLELSKVDVALRYEAHITGIPINTLAGQYRQLGKKIVQATKRIAALGGSLHIEQWPTGDATLRDIEAYLAMLRDSKGLNCDMLLIDYLALLRTGAGGDARWEKHGDLVREARRLASKYGLRLWSANQTPKDKFNTAVIRLSDVSDTVENARVADVVVGLCQTPREKEKARMRLALLKNRLGGHEGLVVDCNVRDDTQVICENRQHAHVQRAYSEQA